MLKILQVRLQQYVNHELPDVQDGFRKGRGTRDQIANIHWIIEKAREYQKSICFIDYTKAFDCVDHNKLWKIQVVYHRHHEKPVCRSRSLYWIRNNGLVPNWERSMSRLYVVTLLI